MLDLLTTFATNLKAIRLERGLTQEALADACELHRTYIGALERGERNISLRNLEKISHVLGIPAADLLTGPDGD